MSTATKTVIYQLVVRYFGNLNTTNQRDGTIGVNGCGRFADINDAAVPAIKELGATHIWLTGCLRQATLTAYPAQGLPADDPDVVKGIAGSFYAVRDYFDVCPDYSLIPAQRMTEFDVLVGRIHQAGMKVLIDLVPNHVARGYQSVVKPGLDFGVGDDQSRFFARDNSFFYLVNPPNQSLQLSRPSHWNPPGYAFDGKFPPEDGSPGHVPKASGDNCTAASPTKDNWYETVKLNYGFNFADGTGDYAPRPRTWDCVDTILAYWQAKGVDGFRCDMAHLVPRQAWEYLIKNARSPGRDPGCFFLAEAYPTSDRGYPITNLNDLIAAGFDAVYHSDAYNALKRIYQGLGSQDDYNWQITPLSSAERSCRLAYLENHDERRVASPIVSHRSDGSNASPGDSGFGSPDAGYQLAPLHFLFGNGPVLLFNGQEVGEPGAGIEGFSTDDGRTTAFDYWCMPEFVKWVNGHAYDGGGLSPAQTALRQYYADVIALCQDPSVRGDGYWGLKYFNRSSQFPDCADEIYTFARFQDHSGRLLVVAVNFHANSGVQGRVRIPQPLAQVAGLPNNVTVRLLLDRAGAKNDTVAQQTSGNLTTDGFLVTIPHQTCHVYAIA
ncbi:MAG TPA: alpha-amylase family glycosyl hydrolase [Isosphaeraceae bacterium]|nr:alpha-amylase family glycosyl hydrolase [Isosphaeraceae bacterium]